MTHNTIKEIESKPIPAWDNVIPAIVILCDALDFGARVLYGLIRGLSHEEGYAYCTNAYLAKLLKVDIRTIQLWLAQLKDQGFVDIELETQTFGTKRRVYLTDATALREKHVTARNEFQGRVKSISGGHETDFTHNTVRIIGNKNRPLTPQSGESGPRPRKAGRAAQKVNPRAAGTNPRAVRLKENREWAQKVVDRLAQAAERAGVDLKIRDDILFATKPGSIHSDRWELIGLNLSSRNKVVTKLQQLGISP